MHATNALKLLYKIQNCHNYSNVIPKSLLEFVSNKMGKLIFVKTSLSVTYRLSTSDILK